MPLSDMDKGLLPPGEMGMYEQYYRNARALRGDAIYDGGSGDGEDEVIGGRIFISATAPENPNENDIWFDLNQVR